MKETIRRIAAILITVCMLVSCMPFGAFADNEPATPTDLAPVEEEKPEEPGEEEPAGEAGQEEPGKEEPAEEEAGEEPGKEEPAEGETTGGDPADGGPSGEGGNGEGTEGAQAELPELHYGQNGLRGTLKAGQEYKAVLRPEYSWNILVTLKLIPKAGQTVSSTGVQMRFDGDKKELTQIENEDPESTGISLQFGVYAANEKEHTILITVPFDADFILTAVKRPKQETEQEDEEEAGNGEETAEPGNGEGSEGGQDGEEPAGETGEEGTGTSVTDEGPEDGEETGDGDGKTDGETEEEAGETDGDGEPEEPADEEEPVSGEDGEEQTEEPAENGEPEEEPEENKEPEEKPEEPAADPVKKEPATPTDLAPLEEEIQEQPVSEGTKAGDTKKTEDKKNEEPEKQTEEPEVLPTDEELLALGYYGIQVVMIDGADIFDSMEDGAEPVAHIDAGEVLWIKPTENDAWAEIYRTDEGTPAQYIRWDDVMINRKPETGEEEEEELPARSLEITSTLSGMMFIPIGTPVVMTAELINFREDDICTYQWQYLDEETDTYIDIDGANELTYSYEITRENFFRTWRLVVLIANAG